LEQRPWRVWPVVLHITSTRNGWIDVTKRDPEPLCHLLSEAMLKIAYLAFAIIVAWVLVPALDITRGIGIAAVVVWAVTFVLGLLLDG